MKNAAGILLVIYLFFLVPWLAGAFIDAAAGVKRRNISSTYANGFVAMLGIFWGVAVLFLYRGCTLEKLSMVWMFATITICVASILANKKAIYGCFKHKRKSENGHKAIKIAMVVSIIAILFSVSCIKPQMEQTVQTVMTSIDTNSAYISTIYWRAVSSHTDGKDIFTL